MKSDRVNLPIRLSLTKTTSSVEPWQSWSLRLTDVISGVLICEAQITNEQFSEMFGGHAHATIETLGKPELWGATHEHKTEILPVKNAHDREAVRAAAEALEVDGWKATADYGNMHRRSKGGYSVTYHRYLRDGVPIIVG